MSRTPTEVIEDHLAKRLAGDVEADIKANYASDIVILSSFGTYKGHDGVRESAAKLAEALGQNAVFTYNRTLIEGDYALLEWSADSKGTKVCDGADSFVVEGGKIIMQTVHFTPVES